MDAETLDELCRLARLLADDLAVHPRGLAEITANAARIAASSRQLQQQLEVFAPDTGELPTIKTQQGWLPQGCHDGHARRGDHSIRRKTSGWPPAAPSGGPGTKIVISFTI
jgi:hypothetical protein